MEKAVRGVEQAALPEGVDNDHPAGLVRVGATEGWARCCWPTSWRG